MTKPRKVLVIGSGPIVIGQAAEFDYAGTQACRALREEGVETVLVNSNPATIMTDEDVADVVYIEPLTVEFLERVIARERPDGLLPSLGGQTGLNLAVELADAGILERYGVRILGTPLSAIKAAEDRQLFKDLLRSIGEPVPASRTCQSWEEAAEFAADHPLPLIIRPAFTLGGTGGGVATTPAEFERIVKSGLAASPIHQVLVETSLLGWKELEYEVMRDGADTCIIVCNMENLDPMGVHTGDSIVVAPSQTLTDKEHQMLRTASLNIIRALGIEGGCNVQFALRPRESATSPVAGHPPRPMGDGPAPPAAPLPEYYVIEVNPRVSRSSALASKATGYPIARVSAKIAIGRRLDEIPNAVTRKTLAAFEPTLDYCVVKIPRWPFDKFASGDREIGTQMKATGEVMAIGRSFEAALNKAVRSLEFGGRSLQWEDPAWAAEYRRLQTSGGYPLAAFPLFPNDLRLWALMAALRRDHTIEELFEITKIDPWFLAKLRRLVQLERRLLNEPISPSLLREAKAAGMSDVQIAVLADVQHADQVRELRRQWGIRPVYKMVDTCAAEFEAVTPYFYSSIDDENEALPQPGPVAAVIGSGPIRIGQGIEFDYCSVHSAWALHEAGYRSVMINSNPETVSTDFDTSDRLYFEPLDEEAVRDVLENEGAPDQPIPAIVQFGGQTAVNLAGPLHRAGVPIVGSGAEAIDLAEDRRRFEEFLSGLGIPQPPGGAVLSVEQAIDVAQRIGYPVLVRPSYVLGGRAMEIVQTPSELVRRLGPAFEQSGSHPVLIDKYLEGKEVEIDAICDGIDVLIPGVMEHIERAGVHSGDSMAIYPPVNLHPAEIETIVDYSTKIALGLGVRGLMNAQYVVIRPDGWANGGPGQVYVLEVNPRASRTVPYIAKATGVPVVKLATQVMLGQTLADLGYRGGLWPVQPLVAIKAPVFSMSKLAGVDTFLGPEMKSTGEVMGIDRTLSAALVKTVLAAGLRIAPGSAILLSIADRDKPDALPIVRLLAAAGCRFFATEGTAELLRAVNIPVVQVPKKLAEGHPNCVDVIRDGTVQGVINTVTGRPTPLRDGFEIRRAAAERRIPCFTSLDTARAAADALAAGNLTCTVSPLPEYRRAD
ncbi:MAG: carbamoyl phosphate synthase large subunit [Dehalococcoidia bacterium]|nr:MAG: carbamoyl phosphate synthase large subunit [Dehalococcoidia bacterium]